MAPPGTLRIFPRSEYIGMTIVHIFDSHGSRLGMMYDRESDASALCVRWCLLRLVAVLLQANHTSTSLNAGNMMAQGLGGLLAAGILGGLEGARGIRGWRWVCRGFVLIEYGRWANVFLG